MLRMLSKLGPDGPRTLKRSALRATCGPNRPQTVNFGKLSETEKKILSSYPVIDGVFIVWPRLARFVGLTGQGLRVNLARFWPVDSRPRVAGLALTGFWVVATGHE